MCHLIKRYVHRYTYKRDVNINILAIHMVLLQGLIKIKNDMWVKGVQKFDNILRFTILLLDYCLLFW